MTTHIDLLIIVAKTAILLLGGSITYYALRAYGRTGDPSLRALSIGFGIVTVGALIGGVSHQIIGTDLAVGIAIDSLLTAVGFGVIVYSLYVE
ncbi:hypothetical protein C461_10568 [Halorubrum aidingense JCM 13560]|uniref:YapH protein n=1 Tax=Halorubrum aidingense JCM 13560 TaxID=1230454 RepID=M0P8K5_9EURY|nr:hypothetical protein [Halorubrum aidingense]EMA66477.1 hypothetical protein C461_10568 [Halorubrum aidingense JCM 13560]